MSAEGTGDNALVIWGSTGRRLQFSKDDLAMPERVRELPNANFYEKQWETVAGFWFNRVLKESALQLMRVEDIVSLIEKNIEERWQARRTEQALYKKRKRLLAGNGPAGTPSPHVLLTNVCALAAYDEHGTAESREGLVSSIKDRVEELAKDTVSAVRVLVDSDDSAARAAEEPSLKKPKTEGTDDNSPAGASGEPAPLFDDHVAVVCTLSSKEKAALAIAHLHGSTFDGRRVICRFWDPPGALPPT